MEKSNVVKAKLVAKKDGIYTVYVFELLEKSGYVMCTRLPNWDVPIIKIDIEGYLTYESAVAGEKYFIANTDSYGVYQYTNIYFKNFIEIGNKQEEIII